MKLIFRLVSVLLLTSLACLAAAPLSGRYVFAVAGTNRWGHFNLAGAVVLRTTAEGCRVVAGEQDFNMHGFYLAPHFFANGASRSVIQSGSCRMNADGSGTLVLKTGLPNVSVGPGVEPLGVEQFAVHAAGPGCFDLTEIDQSAIASGKLRRQMLPRAAPLRGSWSFRLHGDSYAQPEKLAGSPEEVRPVATAGGLMRIDAQGRLEPESRITWISGLPDPQMPHWHGVLNVPATGGPDWLPPMPAAAAPPTALRLTGVVGPADGFGRVALDLNAGASRQISLAAYEVDGTHLELVETDDWGGVTGGAAVRIGSAPAGRPLPPAHPTAVPAFSADSAARGAGRDVIGYWENYGGGRSPKLKLRDVSPDFDVIDVISADPKPPDYATIYFRVDPRIETAAAFKQDLKLLQARGKKVLLTIGGGGSFERIETDAQSKSFVDSVSAIIREYGFNGIDIDFENDSVQIEPGDTDLFHPTSPDIVELSEALHELKHEFGPKFMITLVPETQYVNAGLGAYGGLDGSYLPLIVACRDILSFVDVQYYNSAAMTALDGRVYSQNTGLTRQWSPDFQVAMTEMLLHGFRMANGQWFPALPAPMVAFGVPAVANPQTVVAAMRYLVTGKGFGGRYHLRNPKGYLGLRGVMMWSINIDQHNQGALSQAAAKYLHALPGIGPGN